MNRRSFFKVVTGFVAGIFAVGSVKEKPKLRDFDAHLVLGDDFDEKDLMPSKKIEKGFEYRGYCFRIKTVSHWPECFLISLTVRNWTIDYLMDKHDESFRNVICDALIQRIELKTAVTIYLSGMDYGREVPRPYRDTV